jgi:DNA-binding XRE family transcriptional regulator
MDEAGIKRLEADGWKFGDADDFLGLTPEESAYLDIRMALADELKARREKNKVTQKKLASRLGSSQSRVAKMEAGDPSVSIDLLIRSLLASGATRQDLAKIIG